MALKRSNAPGILSPEQVTDLVIRPAAQASVALQTATVTTTDRASVRVPVLLADPAVAWVDESSPIPLTDGQFGSLDIVPTKIAAITIASSEVVDDADIDPINILGNGLVRDLARALDRAWFGALPSPAQSGLGALAAASGSTVQTVSAGSSWSSLDPFAEAAAAVEQEGGNLSAFVANPADALALAKIKASTGSQVPLLAPGQDPAQPARRLVEGRPLLVSSAVAAGTVWAYDSAATHVVIRREARLDLDRSTRFTTDEVALRLTCRVGFGYSAPARVVKIVKS